MPILFLIFILIFPASSASAGECQLSHACAVGKRSYHVRVPDNWDGKTTLPVLLHFHGWGRQGGMIINHPRISGATRNMGVLLIAPNGLGRSWSFWQAGSRDVAFVDAVLGDAAKRWPIDKSRVFISGFSYGGAMAWRYACEQGAKINTVLAIAGTLQNENENCTTAVNLRHTHGTRDTVMDYPYGEDGNVEGAVTLWRNKNRCQNSATGKTHWKSSKGQKFSRYTWSSCASGKTVILDVHQGGHKIPHGWIRTQLKELL